MLRDSEMYVAGVGQGRASFSQGSHWLGSLHCFFIDLKQFPVSFPLLLQEPFLQPISAFLRHIWHYITYSTKDHVKDPIPRSWDNLQPKDI